MDLTIVGIGTASINPAEYVTPQVLQDYLNNIDLLKIVLDKRSSNPDSTTPVTFLDYNIVVGAIKHLSELAKNGTIEADDSVGLINMTMANQLNDIMKSLKAVGISASSDVINIGASAQVKQAGVDAIQQWQGLAGFGVEQFLINAKETFTTYKTQIKTALGVQTIDVQALPSRTLQSLVELEYVKNANELIFGRLESLETALQTTKSIMGTLTLIQTISNQIQISGAQTPFQFPPLTNADIPSATYNALIALYTPSQAEISADPFILLSTRLNTDRFLNTNFFAEKIREIVQLGDHQTFHDYYKVIASAYFSQLFPSAVPITYTGIDLLNAKYTLATQLADLQRLNPGAATSANSLASNLMRVIQDISTHFVQTIPIYGTDPNSPGVPVQVSSYTINLSVNSDPAMILQSLKNWIIDGQDIRLGLNVENEAGAIQDNINAALRTATNLNDTQKENVRRYLFLFEEFYKSAGNILVKLSQILEKISKGIAT
jgi:hypothetical protein